MTKLTPCAFLAALALISAPVASQGTTYLIDLNSAQPVPPNGSAAVGLGIAVLDATNTLHLTVHHTVTGATAAHIHQAPAGNNGSISAPLSSATSPITASLLLNGAQVVALGAWDLYINIHSGAFPGGEIRGQIIEGFPSQVFISEYCNDPLGPAGGLDTNMDGVIASSSDQADDEFVEIVNGTSAPVNMGNWTLSDGFGLRHTFALGTTLNPGCAIVVFGGGDMTNYNTTGRSGVIADSGTLGLNNTSDSITIRDGGGATVAATSWSSGGPGDGDGEAVTRSPETAVGTFGVHTATASGNTHSSGARHDGITLYCPALLPALQYPGTDEDFVLATGLNFGACSTGASQDLKNAIGGDYLTVCLTSPSSTFSGGPIILATQISPTGSPLTQSLPAPLNSVWISPYFILVDGTTSTGPLGSNHALTPNGLAYGFVIPAPLSGMDIALQAGVIHPLAANGLFAASEAHVITVQ